MAERFDAALDALRARMGAILGDDAAGITTTYAEPEVLQRAILSGYVPTDDAEQAMKFVTECGDALLELMGEASSARAMRAALRSTVAQVLVLGVMLERQEDG